MKKQQEFQLEMQKIMLERQKQMNNMMRERAMAMQIGKSRDTLVRYLVPFTGFVTVGALAAYFRRKNPVAFVPLVPLYFVCGYNYDMAYGDMLTRIRREAEHILEDQSYLVSLPKGMPTFEEIEKLRQEQLDDVKSRPNEVFL